MIDLRPTEQDEAFREEARLWLAQNVPSEPLASLDTAKGFDQHRKWEATLHGGRWSAITWPLEYGGRGASYLQWLIFEEEYYRADAPARVNQNGIFLLAPTLLEVGTVEQRGRFLPRMSSGSDIWCQGWSEPDAGSDLAAIRSTAELVHGGTAWRINGHKTWCSRGAYADWLFGLFRTDPTKDRHRGLSYLLIPLSAPGITIQPIAKFDGEHGFADIFFDDVLIGVENTLGDAGGGWSVAMKTAAFERGVMLRSPARFTEAASRLLRLGAEQLDFEDPVNSLIVDAWMDAEAYRLHTLYTLSRVTQGGSIGPEASMNKIFWSEMDIKIHELALAVLGDRCLLTKKAPDAQDGGRWVRGWMSSLAGTIFAGTNEIQRNIVGDLVLRLPRE